jgi:hypothetical protein
MNLSKALEIPKAIPKRYNTIFPKIQRIRDNKCSFQNWFSNFFSISGLSQI